ncbi:phosphatidylserine decarboxylase [bacterium]|nr:phosphatidylserine decarboxylase [bacterium]
MFAAEGIPFIAPVIVLFLLALYRTMNRPAWYTYSLTSFFALLLLGMLMFFRDPQIELPGEHEIVAPTHGTVLSVIKHTDGSTEIDVFLSLLDVHAIRTVVSGKISNIEYQPGKFFPASQDSADVNNEYIRFTIETPYGIIKERILAGLVTRRIVHNVLVNDSVKAGQRIGFIRFGSRSEVTIPPGLRPLVAVGDKLKGGITPFAEVIPGNKP